MAYTSKQFVAVRYIKTKGARIMSVQNYRFFSNRANLLRSLEIEVVRQRGEEDKKEPQQRKVIKDPKTVIEGFYDFTDLKSGLRAYVHGTNEIFCHIEFGEVGGFIPTGVFAVDEDLKKPLPLNYYVG